MSYRTLRLALAISAILNLFVVGLALGGSLAWARLHKAAQYAHDQPIRAAGEGLSPADRARFHALLLQIARDSRGLRGQARHARGEAGEVFAQPSFDSAKAKSALLDAQTADFALRARLEGAVVDFAATLPPSERAVFAQALARRGPLRQPKIDPAAAIPPPS